MVATSTDYSPQKINSMNYAKIAFTDYIKALQEQHGSRATYERVEQSRSYDGLMPQAIQFIEERNSFYIASYGENEFPYIQHRGGPKGFLKALDDQTSWPKRSIPAAAIGMTKRLIRIR